MYIIDLERAIKCFAHKVVYDLRNHLLSSRGSTFRDKIDDHSFQRNSNKISLVIKYSSNTYIYIYKTISNFSNFISFAFTRKGKKRRRKWNAWHSFTFPFPSGIKTSPRQSQQRQQQCFPSANIFAKQSYFIVPQKQPPHRGHGGFHRRRPQQQQQSKRETATEDLLSRMKGEKAEESRADYYPRGSTALPSPLFSPLLFKSPKRPWPGRIRSWRIRIRGDNNFTRGAPRAAADPLSERGGKAK